MRNQSSVLVALPFLLLLSATSDWSAFSQTTAIYAWTTFAGQLGGAGNVDGTGSAARFFNPAGIAMDTAGNVFVADQSNYTIRKVTLAGVVTTLAGSAKNLGSSDGTGSAARFNNPTGVAVDSAGNVFVADQNNHTIRKVTSAGVVTTLAGSAGASGTSDGIGSAARFYYPCGVAVDSAGNVFVADQYNNTIRKVTPAGVVTTLAGSGGSYGSADGTGSTARFYYPTGVAVDSAGNVFVADRLNRTLRKVTSAGVVTTLAGRALAQGSADGTGSAARFNGPEGVAVDSAGNVFVSDYYLVRKVTPAGVVTTLAGSAAQFDGLFGVAVDSAGNLLVADQYNHAIRKVTVAGVVTTLAGLPPHSGSADGTGSAARFDFPYGVAVDSANNVFVADDGNCTIRKVTPAGVVTTLAGSDAGFYGSADGTGGAARFYSPCGVAVDSAGNVFVADTYNDTIRKVTPAGAVTTLAGSAEAAGSADGTGGAARFYYPYSVAVDSAGSVFVADSSNHTIRKVTSAGVVTTLAGSAGSYGSADGTGSTARFYYPGGVAVDSAGNVFVADTHNSTIRKVTPSGLVTTLAGSAGAPGTNDGIGGSARFNGPDGMAVDGAGNLFVADGGNHTIRKVTPAGAVTTVGGVGGAMGGADGPGSSAKFAYPYGIAVDSVGNLFVADTYNNAIRKGSPALGCVIVANVRAIQRSGAEMVDIYYDLSGTAAATFVSVLVSVDGGASYTLQTVSITGDGAAFPALPGNDRHLVWDAGADLPGQFSTKMRLVLSACSAQTASPFFTLDTRAMPTGTLTGLVQGSVTALANAKVRIDNTPFTTNTAANGRFTLATVPAGSGYLLKVSAAGFASKSLPGINVVSGTTDLGTITLGVATGPYQVIPLAPDVNPATTTVEQGGAAYRYYLVQNSAGQPQGGVAASVQVVSGGTVPQANDVSSYWPGQVAGISDADGIVRIAIPSSALGTPGTSQTIQLSLTGQVQQTFNAQAVPRRYGQVWRHKLGAGGSVEVLPLVSVEGDSSRESDVCRSWTGGTLTGESISRLRTDKIQLEAGFDVGSSLSVSAPQLNLSAGGEASALAGIFAATELKSTYAFDEPGSTDAAQNAMKLYVDLGNILSAVPGRPSAFYGFAQENIEPLFLNSKLRSVEGLTEIGGEVSGEVTFGSPLLGPVGVSFDGGVSADAELISGVAANACSAKESATVHGVAESGTAMVNAGLGDLGGVNTVVAGGPRFAFSTSAAVELLTKSWTRQGERTPYRTEQMRRLSLDAQHQNPIGAWQRYDPAALYGAYERDFIEDQEKTGQSPTVSYGWSVRATQQNFGVNLGLNLGLFGVNIQGEVDQGAEAVNERGALWRSRYWPTESYPAVTSDLFPTQPWSSLLSQWGIYAAGPIGQGIYWIATEVDNAAGTVVHVAQQVGTQTYNAVLSLGRGALADGSQLISSVSSSVSPLFGGNALPKGRFPFGGPHGPRPLDATAANLAYGIGGVYRFQSANSFNGSATLTISYSSDEVAGLNAADLRVYYLPDSTNRWQLVGGTVDQASNTVSATITALGTYAVAPPLPTSDLQLLPSTNALPADGVSQMTIMVTNLVLNTGNAATQQWVFTATAAGINILNPDLDSSAPGVQVMSTNGTVTLLLGAPRGGYVAHVSLSSVVGDASGSTAINLIDNTPPAVPASVSATPGQSRIWVSWRTNSEPDLAGYRVYYRAGAAGPPWDGTSTVEGSPSPVQVSGTNVLLRGLALGTNYFVAVSALDTTGNESPLSGPVSVTMSPGAPAGPTGVAARFGSNGTNILMWALSEDDGYNDRDVIRYEVFRAVLLGGLYTKVAEVPAGIDLYCGTNLAVSPTQYVAYAVAAVASNGLSSAQAPATRYMADGRTVDTDGDGISDSWMLAYFGHPTGKAGDQSFAWNDPAGDGLSNLQKYLLGRNPLVWDNLHFVGWEYLADGRLRLTVFAQAGHNYTLLAATNQVTWTPALTFACTNGTMDVFDPYAKAYPARFYRLAPPVGIAGPRLGLGSARPLSSNGLDLALFSVPGLQYRVDASGDLLNWTVVTNFISTNAVMYFRDASATNYSRRFYRAVAP